MLVCRGEVREFGLTGLTRNQVSLTAPGVRIPPSPPISLQLRRFCGRFAANPRVLAQFALLAAPETGEFEPRRGNFGILSLFQISVVPRENRHQTRLVPARKFIAESSPCIRCEKPCCSEFLGGIAHAWAVCYPIGNSECDSSIT
jgi:hypothetical protein